MLNFLKKLRILAKFQKDPTWSQQTLFNSIRKYLMGYVQKQSEKGLMKWKHLGCLGKN